MTSIALFWDRIQKALTVKTIIIIGDLLQPTSQNANAYPAPLVLLAADAGQGWVPLGATIDKSGRTIASVFEDPSIQPSFTQKVSSRMFRSQASSLTVKGAGLRSTRRSSNLILEFEPPLASQPRIFVSCGCSRMLLTEDILLRGPPDWILSALHHSYTDYDERETF